VIVLALFFLVPIALLTAAVAMAALKLFNVLPVGVSRPVTYSLLSTVCLGLLFLGLTIDDLVLRPARLQKELVGQQIGSPLRLRRYETHGFQDPYYKWRYSAPPELIHRLKSKCRSIYRTSPAQCLVAERQDGSWWQGIGLEGDAIWLIGSDG
jgi:hypothetical protein